MGNRLDINQCLHEKNSQTSVSRACQHSLLMMTHLDYLLSASFSPFSFFKEKRIGGNSIQFQLNAELSVGAYLFIHPLVQYNPSVH